MPPFSLFGNSRSNLISLPYPSALSTLIAKCHEEYSLPPATPETLSSSFGKRHPSHLQSLALTVQHNLQYQHDWTDLRIHTHLPFPGNQNLSSSEQWPTTGEDSRLRLLPRPLISGLPPQRLYLHPDDQLALIAADKRKQRVISPESRGDAGSAPSAASGDAPKELPEAAFDDAGLINQQSVENLRKSRREWVLPTHLREKWSLRNFAEVFDSIPLEPWAGEADGQVDEAGLSRPHSLNASVEKPGDSSGNTKEASSRYEGTQDEVKRVLLATLGDDSTVVYYVVHDGIVKPRQN